MSLFGGQEREEKIAGYSILSGSQVGLVPQTPRRVPTNDCVYYLPSVLLRGKRVNTVSAASSNLSSVCVTAPGLVFSVQSMTHGPNRAETLPSSRRDSSAMSAAFPRRL